MIKNIVTIREGGTETPKLRGKIMCNNERKMKILFFDIETSPVLAWIWRTGTKINISHGQIKKGMSSDIICTCWKWNYKKKVHCLNWDIKKQNSEKMIRAFTKEIEQADIAIAHNGIKFDVKHINTQRLMHDQKPIAWPTIEDTLTQFRKYFYFPSYKLDFLGKTLVGAGKDKMQFQDWIDVVENKEIKALDKMIKYCKKDVLLLEKVFNRASSFFAPKINAGLILGTGRYACPRCGSKNIIRHGFRASMARRYQRLFCTSCGCTFAGQTIQ